MDESTLKMLLTLQLVFDIVLSILFLSKLILLVILVVKTGSMREEIKILRESIVKLFQLSDSKMCAVHQTKIEEHDRLLVEFKESCRDIEFRLSSIERSDVGRERRVAKLEGGVTGGA
jgi:hypothetical protein